MKSLFFFVLLAGVIALLPLQTTMAAEPGNAPHCSIYSAAGISDAGLFNQASCECIINGGCTFDDLLKVIFNGSGFIFGISASLALLFFIIGGALLLISGGNQNNIDKGKRMISASVIGLIIIFTAWTVVNLLVVSLSGNPDGTIFGGKKWFDTGALFTK